MTTFNWNVTKLDTRTDENNTDIVITAWFKITGVDGNYIATYENGVGLNEPTATFIPYNQLTETQLIQWCKDILGVDYCQLLEQSVQNKIDKLKVVNTSSSLPWNI